MKRKKYYANIGERRKQTKQEKTEWKDRIKAMDRNIRATINAHKRYLCSLTEPVEVSKKSLILQLQQNIRNLDKAVARPGNPLHSTCIELVSVDVNYKEIHRILGSEASFHPEIETFFDEIGGLKIAQPNKCKTAERFIYRTHVTLDHPAYCSQNEIHNVYDELIGSIVNIDVTGFFFSKTVAALSVKLSNTAKCVKTGKEHRMPPCRNKFVHITTWCGENVSAKQSNQLPQKVLKKEGQQVMFHTHHKIEGRVSFW